MLILGPTAPVTRMKDERTGNGLFLLIIRSGFLCLIFRCFGFNGDDLASFCINLHLVNIACAGFRDVERPDQRAMLSLQLARHGPTE